MVDHVTGPAMRIPGLCLERGFRFFASCYPAMRVPRYADGLLGYGRLEGRTKGNEEGDDYSESH